MIAHMTLDDEEVARRRRDDPNGRTPTAAIEAGVARDQVVKALETLEDGAFGADPRLDALISVLRFAFQNGVL